MIDFDQAAGLASAAAFLDVLEDGASTLEAEARPFEDGPLELGKGVATSQAAKRAVGARVAAPAVKAKIPSAGFGVGRAVLARAGEVLQRAACGSLAFGHGFLRTEISARPKACQVTAGHDPQTGDQRWIPCVQ